MAWYDALPRPQFTQFPQVETGSSWYTVLKLPQNIYAICEPRHFQEVISFLIPGTKEALLLDTGMGIRPIRPVVEQLTGLPVTVVNTHSHFDHVGGNGEFSAVWAWETEASRRRARQGWAPEPEDENISPEAFLDGLPHGSTYRQPPYSMKLLVNAQRFDLGGRVWEVLHSPGHSGDSIVLFCEAEKLLCTGDTLYPGTLYAQQAPETYRDTLQMLADRFSDYTLLCSHNEPIRPGGLLARSAAALTAMLDGKTTAKDAGDGLWLHTWQDIQILSHISG